MEMDGKMRKTSETTENVGNNGKHRKQRKASETTENIGNNRKCRKTTENVGNVGIGTGGNMVHDNIVTWVVEWMESQLNGKRLVAEMDRR